MAATPDCAVFHDPATLPRELFHDIAKEFTARERFRCMRVSRRWYQALTTDKLSWTDLDSADLTTERHRSRAFRLADGCLKTIRFSGNSAVEAEEMIRVAAQSPLLETIHISDRGGLVLMFAQMIKYRWPGLQVSVRELVVDCEAGLCMSFMHHVLSLVRHFPTLSKLTVTDKGRNSPRGIQWPLLNALRQLRSLKLTRHARLALTPVALHQLCRAAPELESLELNNISFVNRNRYAPRATAFELQLPVLTDLKLVFLGCQEWLRLPSSLKRLQIYCCKRKERPNLTLIPPFLPALEEFSCDYDFVIHGEDGRRVSMWQRMIVSSNCQLKKLCIFDSPQGCRPNCTTNKEVITLSEATLAAINFVTTQWVAPEKSAVSMLIEQWQNSITQSECVALPTLTALALNNRRPGDLRIVGITDSAK